MSMQCSLFFFFCFLASLSLSSSSSSSSLFLQSNLINIFLGRLILLFSLSLFLRCSMDSCMYVNASFLLLLLFIRSLGLVYLDEKHDFILPKISWLASQSVVSG
ncbi:hypothetical protein ACJBU6_00233 [Exserohilum turcicum]